MEIVSLIDQFGNIKKEGPVLYDLFGNLSVKIEEDHPDSTISKVYITMADVRRFEQETGEKMTKK